MISLTLGLQYMEGWLNAPYSQAASRTHTFLIHPTNKVYNGMRLLRMDVYLLNGFQGGTDRSKIADSKKYILQGKPCHNSEQ